jgi:hypothetical protein
MNGFVRHLLAASLALLPLTAGAQEMRLSRAPAAATEAASAAGLESRNQLALEAGFLSLGVSYARRIGATPWSVGAGVWGAWEPPSTFEGSFFEPVGVVAFGRYRAAPWLHADLGLTAARYQWADDCSDCGGSFVGARSAALVGYRWIFIGPELSAGWASDDHNGSQFGMFFGGQVRLVLGWGS